MSNLLSASGTNASQSRLQTPSVFGDDDEQDLGPIETILTKNEIDEILEKEMVVNERVQVPFDKDKIEKGGIQKAIT